MGKKTGTKTGNNAKNPSPNALVYTGAIRGGAGAQPDDAITVRLSYASYISGASSGFTLAVNNLGVTTATDWLSYANTYDEFRVLGFEMDWLPYWMGGNTGPSGAVTHSAGLRFVTHSADALVNPTADQAVQHADWVPAHTGERFKSMWKMSGADEAAFQNTASPPSVLLGSIYCAFPAAAYNGTYGIQVATYLVQFRGRK